MNALNRNAFSDRTLMAFSLTELLVVLVIIGNSGAGGDAELDAVDLKGEGDGAQQQLTFLHSLEKSYFYTYSRYSDDLEELGFEQATLVTDGGNANYRIEVVEAGENGFKAQAVSVVDFDKDGVFNVWEIDQDKNLKETVKD